MTLDGKMTGLGKPIPEAKLKALREALERDGTVTFKNGSVVERVIELKDPVPGGMDPAPERVIRYLVKRPAGGIARYNESELRSAYAMALRGPQPRKQPSGDPAMFGDDPPF